MWQNILKAPITIGRTRIGMKPFPEDEEEDCCENAKNRWKIYIIRKYTAAGTVQYNVEGFKEKYNYDFDVDNGGDCIKLYDVSDNTYAAKKYDCETFKLFLERHRDGIKGEILDEWNKCEGR